MSDLDKFLKLRSALEEELKADPENWEARKSLAHALYNQGYTKEAAELVWNAPSIPSVDLEIAFAAKVVGKARPSRAIRLLNNILANNQGKAVQNLGLANALMHHGMVMQAARFYGAALEVDPDLVNPDLEHFLLWVDDSERIWGNFKEELPKLEELPWIKRDAREAAKLKKSMDGHTTPVRIPGLKRAIAETPVHEAYVQSGHLGADVTPPPSVTIPIDQVKPEHRVLDPEKGASQPVTAEEVAKAAAKAGSAGVALPDQSASQPLVPTPLAPPSGHPNPTGGQTVRTMAPSKPVTTSAPADAPARKNQVLPDGKLQVKPG